MPRSPRADDLYDLRVPSDTAITADGRLVAFTVKSASPSRDGYRQAVWIAPADGSEPARQVTLGSRSDSAPRFSPDGTRLAFLSDRAAVLQAGGGGDRPGPAEAPGDGGTQVWVLPLAAGGEARQLTRLPHDVTEFEWSPDGRHVCAVSTAESTKPERKQPRDPEEPPESDYRFMDRLQYQYNGAGFTHDRYSHLWLVDAETGDATRLTSGGWNDGSPAWSPDGTRIAFVSRRHRDLDLDWQFDVFAVDADGRRPVRVSGGSGQRSFSAPSWSPDGQWIAAAGHRFPDPGKGNYRNDVWRFRAGTPGAGENLTAASDLMVGSGMGSDLIGHGPIHLGWDADGAAIVFTAPIEGSYEAWRVDVATRDVTRLTEGRHFLDHARAAALARGGLRWVAVRGDASHAYEVVTFDTGPVAGGGARGGRRGSGADPVTPDQYRIVSDLMATRWADVDLVEPEERWHEVDGRRIQGWLYRAPDRDGRPAPLVVEIHGGPATLYGYSLFWEWQCLVAAGMSVYACNPRGSEGYGQDFVRANFQDWGDGPMRDVMGGVDAIVADGLADPERLGVTGGSYGGYLTSWIVGHTDRFKAAVTCRSVNDMTSQMLSGDIGGPMFGAEEYGKNPWEDHELYWRHSPVAYAASVTTPLLIQHAERDLRVPVTQAEEFFAVLRSLGKPVRLMRVPEETHELTRSGAPFRRVENVVQIVDWFRHFLVEGKAGLPALPKEKRVRP